MTLDQITAAALTLYKEQSPDQMRTLLAEILAEHHRMTWSQFLEESGTLERLAEAMAYGHIPSGRSTPSKAFDDWLDAVGHDGFFDFTKLCGVFAVPAVRVEVFRPMYEWPSDTVWMPPSVPLALATLREFLGIGLPRMTMFAERPKLKTVRLESMEFTSFGVEPLFTLSDDLALLGPETPYRPAHIAWAVRQHAPSATQYRVRLADGEWVTRAV